MFPEYFIFISTKEKEKIKRKIFYNIIFIAPVIEKIFIYPCISQLEGFDFFTYLKIVKGGISMKDNETLRSRITQRRGWGKGGGGEMGVRSKKEESVGSKTAYR